MKYCPNCGAGVPASGKHCPECGASLSLSSYGEAGSGGQTRSNRGLRIAIACVAALCVLTAGLWLLWPHLSSGSAAPAQSESSDARTPASVSTPAHSSSPATAEPATRPASLQPDTWWRGTMYIENYIGSDPPSADSREVWGYLGRENGNRWFFEIYETKDHGPNVPSYLSFYVEVQDDRLVPVVGDQDAWVFDLYLTAQDESRLVVLLDDELIADSWYLELRYPYRSGEESFDLTILMVSQ